MSQDLFLINQTHVLPQTTGSQDQYIQAAMTIPVLSAEEEYALVACLREDNDLDAARRLVMSHLRIVQYVFMPP